jgi:hypothetical protein
MESGRKMYLGQDTRGGLRGEELGLKVDELDDGLKERV